MPFNLGLGLGIGRSAGGTYVFANAEAAAVVAAMTSAPDKTRSAAIDTLVGALKTAGVWTKRDRYYFTAAHANQAAQLNWKNPAVGTLTESGTVNFTANSGYAGSADGALDPSYIPSSDGVALLQDDASIGIWLLTNVGNSTPIDIGANDGANVIRVTGRNSGNTPIWAVNSTAVTTGTIADNRGWILTNRTASNAMEIFRNASSVTTSSQASSGRPTRKLFILASGNSSNAAFAFSTRGCAAAAWGGSLSAGEVTAEYNAIRAYMTAVGVP